MTIIYPRSRFDSALPPRDEPDPVPRVNHLIRRQERAYADRVRDLLAPVSTATEERADG